MSDILCTVCARGGSKGVKKKNIQNVAGKPLLAHAIADIRQWKRDTDLVISTDDDEIASVAEQHGEEVPFMRPQELAEDESPKRPVIQHAVKKMEEITGKDYEFIVDIGVTTPLREPQDIEDCFQVVVNNEEVTNSYTVCEAERNPYFNMVERTEDGYARLSKDSGGEVTRRQDAPKVYEMNASVYTYEKEFLMNTDSVHDGKAKVSVMPRERSIDIDSKLDLKIARCLAEQRD